MTIQIHLLGLAELHKDDEVLPLQGYKPWALLSYLLLTHEVHSRVHLADLLFDEADDPRGALRWCLHQLRQAIGSDYLIVKRQEVGFNFTADYWCDAESLAAGEEIDEYRGDLLEGVYVRDARRFMDWLLFERERLRGQYQDLLANELVKHEQAGDNKQVVEVAYRLLQLDNFNEAWHRALIAAYAALGQREAALAQYQSCVQILKAELNVKPTAETEALYNQVLSADLVAQPQLADLPLQPAPFVDDGLSERPLFVARQHELNQLNSHLNQMLAREGHVVFISGNAGRGKSALAAHFSHQAAISQPELLVVWGQCNAYLGVGDPYLPFRDVLDMLTGGIEPALAAGLINFDQAQRLWATLLPTAEAIAGSGLDLLDVLIPQKRLLEHITHAAGYSAAAIQELQSLIGRRQAQSNSFGQNFLFQQCTNVLQSVAAIQPLLIILEDLQWADTSSLSLFFHLGRRLANHPILILATYRPDEIADGMAKEQGEQLRQLINEFRRLWGDVVIDLNETNEQEDRSFVNAYLDSEPNALPHNFREALYRHTGGHPLFTIELLRDLQERGILALNEDGRWQTAQALDWGPLPARVEAIIEERVNRLENDLRQTLTIASVDGEVFTAQVVARIQEVQDRRLLQRLSQSLERQHRLVRQQEMIAVGSQWLSRYRFTHDLFRQFLYGGLSAAERRYLHGAIGQVLEALYGQYSDQIAIQLAHHFTEAGENQKSRRYLTLAGEQAADQYANDEALYFFNRALALTPDIALEEQFTLKLNRERIFNRQGKREEQHQDLMGLGELVQKLGEPVKLAEVCLRQANYFIETGNYPMGLKAARQAREIGRTVEHKTHQAQASLYQGWALWRQSLYQEALTFIQQCITEARENQSLQLEGDGIRILGSIYTDMGNYKEAKRHLEQALKLCRQTANKREEALTLNSLGNLFAHLQARNYYLEALKLFQAQGDVWGEGGMLYNLAVLEAEWGAYDASYEYTMQGLQLFRENGDILGEGLALLNLGLLDYHKGDTDSGLERCQEALAIMNKLGDRSMQAWVWMALGRILVAKEHFDEAGIAWETALQIRRELDQPHLALEPQAGLAYLALLKGNPTQAQVDIEEVVNYLETYPVPDGLGDRIQLFLSCYQVLEVNGDDRAPMLLRDAYRFLQETAASIEDPALAHSYLHNVGANQAIVTLYEETAEKSDTW